MKLTLKPLLGEPLAQHIYRAVGDLTREECPIVNGRLCAESDFDAVAKWLRARLAIQEDEPHHKDTRTAAELLSEAGYALHGPFATANEYSHLARYYAEGEKLCKFGNESRPKEYHVFWLVRHDVESIQREANPTRDGTYGTSCMSLEIHKQTGFVRLCNRYNHSVPGCDNTLGSNLERVTPGLTAALERDYKIKAKRTSGLEIANAVEIDGHLFFYEQEIGGAQLCWQTQTCVWNGRMWLSGVAIIGPILIDMANPQDARNLHYAAARPLDWLPAGTKVVVHSDEAAAKRAHAKRPDELHIVGGR